MVHRDTQSGRLTLAVSIPALGISELALSGPSSNGILGVHTASLADGRTFQLLLGEGAQQTFGY